MDEYALIWGIVFGVIGFGFSSYGRKQRSGVPLLCGLVLMLLPYFISNNWLLVALGIAICAIPFFVRD